jgi:hypothetical protein
MPVTVAGSDVTGISVELPLAIHITGTVTGPGGVPLSGIDVAAENLTISSGAVTGPDGTYSVVVVAGAYFLSFSDFSGAYDSGYYSDTGFTQDGNNATPVTVAAADVPGINVEMTPAVPPIAHITALSTFLTKTAIGVKWSATEGSNFVTSFDVRYRRATWNGPGFGASVAWRSDLSGTSATLAGVPGSTYCFSARARDYAGLTSDWTAETCTAVPLDDRSLTKSTGWSAKSGTAYFKSTYLQSTKLGAKLTAKKVTARKIAIVASTCPTCGSIKVYWGSKVIKTISLKSAKVVNKKVITVAVWSAPKTGTLTIKVASSGKKVIIDGVAIRRI